MNAKKYLLGGLVLSTVVVAFAVSVGHHLTCETQRGADVRRTALTGSIGKFGPAIDAVLPAAAEGETSVGILDLETGRIKLQPPFEDFDSRADAIMDWIRSNGLDISCSIWRSGAACVTHDMTIVAIEGKCWETATEQELSDNPALAPVRHSPRRLLPLGPNRPDTYAFRTAEGTLGMLRIVGLDQHGRGVTIRYKLINPASSVAAAAEVFSR